MQDGANPVPPGKLASIVISLEMRQRPPARPAPQAAGWSLVLHQHPDVGWYRDLYRRIGADWLWSWRLAMPRERLAAMIHDPAVEVHTLQVAGSDEGLLELDFRTSGECELKLFGLTRPLIGTGAGRWLMAQALDIVWSRPGIGRFWVHTCSMDHPDALAFYQRSGFQPFRRHVEVEDDPRLTGVLPPTAAPQVPLLRPS